MGNASIFARELGAPHFWYLLTTKFSFRPRPHWEAYSAPRTSSWWGAGWLSLPKNPTPALGLPGLGLQPFGPRYLTPMFPGTPSFIFLQICLILHYTIHPQTSFRSCSIFTTLAPICIISIIITTELHNVICKWISVINLLRDMKIDVWVYKCLACRSTVVL